MVRPLSSLCSWVILANALVVCGQDVGIRAPAGFHVELFADDALAHDIFSMTIDSQGRVVVAGRDYVKILHDDNGDGRADRATLFSQVPKSGAHGMVFDGPHLICTGDNSVLRLRDSDGDGQADGTPESWASLKHPEHGANGLVRGPDGWFYLICGNDAGVSSELARTRRSPVVRPECGAVVRFSPDGRQSEIVAHGFRNPYDFDFDALGRMFTVDSDGERDQYLPWYTPTRLFDIQLGQHHGWVLRGWQHSWNRPAYFYDSQPRLAEVGRGSPTGVVVYRHRQFPAEFRGSVLSCCWTLGRVYLFPLEPAGTSYRTQPRVFLETTGEVGFAPVDLAVGPAGELYVAIGGRQTRGSVFRVRYAEPITDPPRDKPRSGRESAMDQVLRADQPLAAWSRARWLPVARRLGAAAFKSAAADAARTPSDRLRALEVLADVWDGVSWEVAERAAADGQPQVQARAVLLLARSTPPDQAWAGLKRWLDQPLEPAVRRAAWEALGQLAGDVQPDADVVAHAERENLDQRTRSAALWAVRSFERSQLPAPTAPLAQLGRRRWELEQPQPPSPTERQLALLADVIAGSGPSVERLEAIRVVQNELGDVRTEPTDPPVYAGYAARRSDALAKYAGLAAWHSRLAAAYPSGDRNVDYELARLLGMLQITDDRLIERLARVWTPDSRVEDDLHYLIVLSRLPGRRSTDVSRATAATLARLHVKMRAGSFFASRNWPARVGELFQELQGRDNTLADQLVATPDFGWPDHSHLALLMQGAARVSAARRLAQHARQTDDDAAWTAELVEVLGGLPADEALPLVRSQWTNFAVRDPIALVLARFADPADRPHLVEALSSVQPNVVEHAARALTTIGQAGKPREIVAAMQALRQASLAKELAPTRRALHELLNAWTQAKLELRDNDSRPAAAEKLWQDWLTQARPELAAQVRAGTGVDAQAWRRRLADVDWSSGDAERGKIVFEKRACARCHRAADRLGPDLAGAAGRLSRDDLFTAIIDPNQEVAPLYQTTQVVTREGKVYQGLIVYESPESTLVQTTPDDTVRVTGQEIVALRKSRQSLMPLGLLNNASDGDLADLFAYLKTLRNAR